MAARLEHPLMSVGEERAIGTFLASGTGTSEHGSGPLDASMVAQLLVTNTCSYIRLQSGHVHWW